MQYVLEKEVFPSTKAKNPGLCTYQKTKKKKILAFALYIDVYPTVRPQPSWSENKAKEHK